MSYPNTVARQEVANELVIEAAPTVVAGEVLGTPLRLLTSDAEAGEDAPVLDWFADLTWQQVVPIAAVMMTLMTGLMCASRLVLGV